MAGHGEYSGESIAKKVARVRLYKRVRTALLRGRGTLDGVRAFFLIGPEAAEVGALKHMLRVSPANAFGLDRDEQCCSALATKWPGALGLHSPLEEEFLHYIIGNRWDFDFLHLDLMGNLSTLTTLMYGRYGQLVKHEGVVAITYLRGRENDRGGELVRSARDSAKTQCRDLDEYHQKTLGADPLRAQTHLTALQSSTEIRWRIEQGQRFEDRAASYEQRILAWKAYVDEMGEFWPIGSHLYRSENSPMGVVIAQRLRPSVWTARKDWIVHGGDRRTRMSVIKKDPMEDLLLEAESLEKEFTSQQTAEILNVSRGTLAAWRAHRTRGTYAL